MRFRLEAATQGFQGGMRQAQASTAMTSRTIGQSMRANKQAFTMAGAAALGLGAAVGAGLASAVSAGMEFESAMNQVKAVSQATETEFQLLSDTAKSLGSTTMFSATEAAEGLNFLAMAGFDATEATEALPGVLNLAAAGGMELAEAADIASNVLTGYGLEAAEISRVTDTMAATFTSANTNLSQLGQAMSFVAPVASGAGLALEETSAAIGMMSDAGIQGTRAGTSLRMAISRLLSPTGPAAEAIERLGLNATTADGQLKSLENVVGQLESSGANTADMMEIFGNRAGPGMAALVDQGSESLSDLTTELENSGGTAERVAETQMEGLKGAITELGSAWEGLQIRISETGIGSTMETVTDSLTGAVRAAEGLPDPVMRSATAMAALVTGAGVVGGGIMILGPRLAEGAAQMRALTRAAGGLRGMALKGGAIGGLVIAITELNHQMTEAESQARETFQGIVDEASTADEALRRIEEAHRETGGATAQQIGERLRNPLKVLENIRHQMWEMITLTSGETRGGPFGALVDSIRNIGTGAARTEAELEAMRIGMVPLKDTVDDLTTAGVLRLNDNLEITQRSMGDIAEDAGPRLMDSFGGMASHAGEAVETVEDLEDAMDRLFGSALGLERATIAYQEMLVDLNSTLQENGATLSLASEAGRENRSAVLDGVEAARDHAVAMMEDGASVKEATAAMQQHVVDLKKQMRQAGFTEEQIQSYIDTLGLAPDDIRTTLHAQTDRAESDVRRYLGLLQEATAKEDTLGFSATRAALTGARQHGGAVAAGGAYLVGEQGPELFRPSHAGMVHSTHETHRILGAQGGQLAGAPPPVSGPTDNRQVSYDVTVQYPPNVPTEESIARENRNRSYLAGE